MSRADPDSYPYTYDARSEKLSDVLTVSNVSGIIQQKHYEYTAIGEISSITDQHNGITYAYTYDKIGRFTNETTNGTSSMTMTYNAIGNIDSKTVGVNTFTYSYSTSHKHAVSGVTYNGTTYSYTYDANGNMTYGADFTNLGSIQARTITYNADNMPIQVSHSSNITTELTYGGTGERVKKRVYNGGNVTDTYYIGDHFEVKGGVVTKYIFAGNLRVAQVKGTTRSFFHKDHLSSSTVMTDASGYELESTEYMPFGSQRSHSGTSTSDYRYTDQELDAENGLYNYNARLYDPFIGRFISADTIVPDPYNPQSLNRYSYCLNNPLIYVDPSGHAEEDDEWAAYIAMWQYVNSLYEVWPQLGGSLAHEMGFMDPISPLVNLWNLGFEGLNAWINVKSLYYRGGGSGVAVTASNGIRSANNTFGDESERVAVCNEAKDKGMNIKDGTKIGGTVVVKNQKLYPCDFQTENAKTTAEKIVHGMTMGEEIRHMENDVKTTGYTNDLQYAQLKDGLNVNLVEAMRGRESVQYLESRIGECGTDSGCTKDINNYIFQLNRSISHYIDADFSRR